VELLRSESQSRGFTVAWITLGIAATAESVSWLRALRETRAEAIAARKPLLGYVRQRRDPSVKMVLIEDSAALVGVGLAALGVALHQLTRESMWDPLASIAIGLLLVSLAFGMARDTGRLLLGAAARDEEREPICAAIERHPGVVAVPEVLTMVLGPDALLVAARVDLDDRLSAARVETIATELDGTTRERVPDVTEVFLDATPTAGDRGAPRGRGPRPKEKRP
jgi:divalent metal cation (Fe/Co/Zn/Cd) transporter